MPVVQTDLANTWTVSGQVFQPDNAAVPAVTVQQKDDATGRALTLKRADGSLCMDVQSRTLTGWGNGTLPYFVAPAGGIVVGYENDLDAYVYYSWQGPIVFTQWRNGYGEMSFSLADEQYPRMSIGTTGPDYADPPSIPQGLGSCVYAYDYTTDSYGLVVTPTRFGVLGAPPVPRQAVTGVKGGTLQDTQAAFDSLVQALANFGLVTDARTAPVPPKNKVA